MNIIRPRPYSFIRGEKLLSILSSTSRLAITRCESKSAVIPEEEDPDKPIKFSTSKAGWKYSPKIVYCEDIPWYKNVILGGTLMAFVIYLMFYREGNDLDEELEMPLGKRLLWIQELHLLDERSKLISTGNDASTVDVELDKIKQLRKKYNYD